MPELRRELNYSMTVPPDGEDIQHRWQSRWDRFVASFGDLTPWQVNVMRHAMLQRMMQWPNQFGDAFLRSIDYLGPPALHQSPVNGRGAVVTAENCYFTLTPVNAQTGEPAENVTASWTPTEHTRSVQVFTRGHHVFYAELDGVPVDLVEETIFEDVFGDAQETGHAISEEDRLDALRTKTDAVLDDIDALMAEQLDAMDESCDGDIGQPRCPLCGQGWHGLTGDGIDGAPDCPGEHGTPLQRHEWLKSRIHNLDDTGLKLGLDCGEWLDELTFNEWIAQFGWKNSGWELGENGSATQLPDDLSHDDSTEAESGFYAAMRQCMHHRILYGAAYLKKNTDGKWEAVDPRTVVLEQDSDGTVRHRRVEANSDTPRGA